MKKYFTIFMTIVFLAILSHAAFAQQVRWRLVTHAMPGTEQQRIAEVFSETVKTLSGGQFTIETYPAGVLFPVFETFDNLANGVVNAAMVYSAYWTGKDPLFNFTTQPGSPLSTYAEGAYLVEKLEPWFEKLYAKHRITYLGHAMVSPIYEQLMSVVPIDSIDKLQGLRIRASGIGGQYYRALGATSVSLSAPEIYTALQTRSIEAAEWTFWDENMRMGFHEVVSYVKDPAFQNGTCEYFPLVVNPASWNALSPEYKEIVLAARDRIRYLSAMVYNHEIIAREKWKDLPNITVVRWTPEEEAQARSVGHKLVYEEAQKSAEGKEFLEIYRTALWDLGYRDEAKELGYEE
ncbi:TRAP transporter substrate-binding protein DctP [Desulfonatronum thioautotrophicum]|uniref:TRAP transporter substrate-binding protein DctP n=1 Tax=Desulfonatronum thioautotrophicum TaxID=617001 RepID=UPI0005EB7DE8|nr:TRAP transporter substrate-binding protein DctP [Desulfonatronum thioautotrophicum]